jgi:hypothetical protein
MRIKKDSKFFIKNFHGNPSVWSQRSKGGDQLEIALGTHGRAKATRELLEYWYNTGLDEGRRIIKSGGQHES